jgi:adenine deaminase
LGTGCVGCVFCTYVFAGRDNDHPQSGIVRRLVVQWPWVRAKEVLRRKRPFTERRPRRVDHVIDVGDLYVLPPFGDAHTHGFDNPNDIERVVATYLRDGIFYALSLTNSIRGKRSVAAVSSSATQKSTEGHWGLQSTFATNSQFVREVTISGRAILS